MEYSKKRKKNSKTRKIIISIISVLVIVLIITIGLIIYDEDTSTDVENFDSAIIGTFLYGDDTKYIFKKNGKGAMFVENEKFNYTFKTENNKLIIDFQDEYVHDATYSYIVENDTLKLFGEDGTAGGEYTLKKE